MTESVTEAVNRVLLTANEEAKALRQATEAARNALFGLVGIFTGRMQQYEERIAYLESKLKLFDEGAALPEVSAIDSLWMEQFGERLWEAHLDSTVDSKMSEVAADVFSDMIKDVDVEVDRIDITLRAR